MKNIILIILNAMMNVLILLVSNNIYLNSLVGTKNFVCLNCSETC